MALTDLTRISTSGIATGSTIDSPILRKDVNFRGSQVGVTSALFDSSDNALEFNDNVKIKLGNGGDLELYHTGARSEIINNTGDLIIQPGVSSNLLLRSQTGAPHFKGVHAAQVEIYYNGNEKIRTTNEGVVVTGILTATSFSGGGGISAGVVTCTGLDLNGNGDVSGNFVIGGDLTVNGTTTTLDTNLTEVDRIEVGANSNTLAGIAVTQSGSADIINLFDGTSEVLTVVDTGEVGIGTVTPNAPLDVFTNTAATNKDLFMVRSATGAFAVQCSSVTASNPTWALRTFGSEDLVFSPGGNANTNEAVRITTDGNINIPFANNGTGLRQKIRFVTEANFFDEVAYISADRTAVSNAPTDLVFATGAISGGSVNTQERLRIKSTGQVAIGTTIEGYSSADDLTVATSGHTGITIRSGNTSLGTLAFSDGTSGAAEYDGYIQYSQNDRYMDFATGGGNVRLRITSGGQVAIGTATAVRALTVHGPGQIHLENTTTGSWVGASLKGSSGTNNYNAYFGILDSNGNFFIDNGSNGDDFVITQGGNVGVNCTPTAKFDVRRDDADGKIAEFHQSTGYGIDIGSSQALAYISSGYNQDWAFKTDPGSGQVERLRITSAGKIEVQGTRAGALQANDDDALKLFTKSTTDDINRGTGITFYTHDGSGYEMGGTIQVAKENGTVNDPKSYMRFSTQSGSTTEERLRIHSHGQLELKVPDANDALKITPSGTNAHAKVNFNTPGNGSAILKVQGTERLSIDKNGQVTNTGTETSYVSTTFSANFAKVDIRGTNIGYSNHYILSYGEGHANDHQLHMVNTLGSLVFRTGTGSNTERLDLNSSGNVLIKNSTMSSSGSHENNVPLCIDGDTNKITLMLGDASTSVSGHGVNDYSGDIRFNGANVAWGDITYYPNGNGAGGSFRFTRNGSTVSTTPNASIGCETIFIGGTADSNRLDEYEEGTWTPVFQNVNTPTYSTQYGRYCRNGSLVQLTGQISVSSGLDTSDGSTVNIGGFPFSGNSSAESCLFSFGRYTNLIPDSKLADFTNVRFGGNYVMLHEGNNADINYAECNSSGTIQFSVSYIMNT